MASEVEHLHYTYNDIHKLIERSAAEIEKTFKPTIFIAIGGGQRTFLKDEATKRNIPIHAIGLSLYESLPGTSAEQIGNQVVRTQWLGPESGKFLLGRKALIVDEVDDSRKTLHYAISELQADVERELALLPESEREAQRTQFGIFVVHNKRKPKLASLPADIPYFAGEEVDDLWLDYPWESSDIDEHDRLAALEKAKAAGQA